MATLSWNRRWSLGTRILNVFWPKDFRPVAPSVLSPDGRKAIVPMTNRSYSDMSGDRLVTFDVRDDQGKFMHHIQSDVATCERWAIGWCGNNTVVVRGLRTGIRAYMVGIDSMFHPVPEPLPAEIIEAAGKLA